MTDTDVLGVVACVKAAEDVTLEVRLEFRRRREKRQTDSKQLPASQQTLSVTSQTSQTHNNTSVSTQQFPSVL